MHTGFGLGRFDPDGSLPAHVHSYEESLYVLEGEVVVQTPGEAARLRPGDYGLSRSASRTGCATSRTPR